MIIGKNKTRPLNPIQFNALAIVFLLVMLPFTVAFITNAGSSSEGDFKESTAYPKGPFPFINSYWVDNGGDNYFSYYDAANPNQPFTALTYVKDGVAPENTSLLFPSWPFNARSSLVGGTPMTSLTVPQTHFHGGSTSYVGASGDGPFKISLNSNFFDLIEEGEAIDKFRFTFIDQAVDYNCEASIFENISFDGSIHFVKGYFSTQIEEMSFEGFEFETSNRYKYTSRTVQHGFNDVCQVGFEITFDLTGFETLNLDGFIGDDWANTSIQINMDNFKTLDDDLPFTSTALPFAGTGEFQLGVEHQAINPVNAGFVIKTATIFLAVGTFVLAIASTPYWDPFRNFVKGAIE